ncbi:glycosyltransferase [Streptomyces sp. NPDC059785]|uniref:glycosyltransferase n=1 Tax=unclassified Streptomyces TaxID=2593676 RepID=UPI003669111E
MSTQVLTALVLVPLLVSTVDLTALALTGRRHTYEVGSRTPPCQDFEVLVPIYGDIAYLENAEFLRPYGNRVLLCTTDSETEDFRAALHALADAHGFRVLYRHIPGAGPAGGRRRVSGTVRDRLIREALHVVRAPYEICLDADTVTVEPLDRLMGVFQESGRDFASVRLVPVGVPGLLLKLQTHEYRLAIQRRHTYPWMVSGACHIARTEVHRAIMDRHSLFFQGNDVEMGLLGDALGYKAAYLHTEVLTTVPHRPRGWLRQRLAWAGGEFRLMAVNAPVLARHPSFFFYGLVITLLLAPLRWYTLTTPVWPLLSSYVIYTVYLLLTGRRQRDWTLLLYPLYSLVNGLVMVPLGWLSYLRMAVRDRNAGIIRVARVREATGGAR